MISGWRLGGVPRKTTRLRSLAPQGQLAMLLDADEQQLEQACMLTRMQAVQTRRADNITTNSSYNTSETSLLCFMMYAQPSY